MMARLIDANMVRQGKFCLNPLHADKDDTYYYQLGWNDAIDAIVNGTPTVDAVSLEDYRSMEQTVNKLTKAISENHIEHGHWIDDWDIGCSVCSECDDLFLWEDFNGVREFNYCPTCGAKMNERGDAQ